jgi:hypothetical protein
MPHHLMKYFLLFFTEIDLIKFFILFIYCLLIKLISTTQTFFSQDPIRSIQIHLLPLSITPSFLSLTLYFINSPFNFTISDSILTIPAV